MLASSTRAPPPTMAYREFTDAHGVLWEVWDVHPASMDRRLTGERRRRLAPPYPGRDKRGGADRRGAALAPSFRNPVAPSHATGWLAFQSRQERRRLAPIPHDWERATDAELAALCEAAVARPARRLVE